MPNERLTSIFVGLLGISLALAPATLAADDKKPPQPSSMVVVKDPVTGKLRQPTAEEAAELNKAAKQTQAEAAGKAGAVAKPGAARKPPTVNGPDGSLGLVLDESSNVYAVATRNPDGKITIQESTGGKAAPASAKAQGSKQGGTNEK